jgi:hypothetical protein
MQTKFTGKKRQSAEKYIKEQRAAKKFLLCTDAGWYNNCVRDVCVRD